MVISHTMRNTTAVYEDLYSDMDGTFAFIAGYTSGGAPYGVTWEQVGIDSDLPFNEKIRLYRESLTAQDEMQLEEVDELPFD